MGNRSDVLFRTAIACALFGVACSTTRPPDKPMPRWRNPSVRPLLPPPPAPTPGAHDHDEERAKLKRAAPQPLVRAPSGSIGCGTLGTLPLASAPSALLGGLLTVRAPEGASASPLSIDVMNAPMSYQDEMGLTASIDNGLLFIRAIERYQLDPDAEKAEPDAIVQPGPLDEEAPKLLKAIYEAKSGTLDIEPVSVGPKKLRGYAGRPRKFERSPDGDAALVLALGVVMPDAALETVAFYAAPRGDSADAGCTRLAERMADTLDLGPRRMERGAGMRRLDAASATEDFAINVPDNYVVTEQRGPDHVIYHVHKMRPIGLYPGEMELYFGSYPHPPPMFHESKGQMEVEVNVEGLLLGKPIVWRGIISDRGGRLRAVEPVREISGEKLYVQISARATRQVRFLEEFRTVAETLTKVPRSR
jgi:hypothetical protein